MSRDILIAGENGEIYHITEDELRSSHRVSKIAVPEARELFRAVPKGSATATVRPEEPHHWGGGVSQCGCDEIQLVKLGVTHDDESS